MSFTKSNLNYQDYSWTAVKGDDPRVSGEPDSTLFSRKEGYEVLYMIIKCLTKWGFTTNPIGGGQKRERLIRTNLPSDVRGQKQVYDWLGSNYNRHN